MIENRLYSDDVLNHILLDEVVIELFLLHIRLHIIYHSYGKSPGVDEIIKLQTFILDWIKVLVFNICY